MGYMVCEECGKYYKLKSGESPFDFEKCECGGTLKYVESPDWPESKDVNPSLSKEPDNLIETSEPVNWMKLGVISVLAAILITVLSQNYFTATYIVWFIPLIVGGIWAYSNKLNISSGAKEGFILGFISMLIVVAAGFIVAGITGFTFTEDYYPEIEFLILSVILFGIISSIGGGILGTINTKKGITQEGMEIHKKKLQD